MAGIPAAAVPVRDPEADGVLPRQGDDDVDGGVDVVRVRLVELDQDRPLRQPAGGLRILLPDGGHYVVAHLPHQGVGSALLVAVGTEVGEGPPVENYAAVGIV